MKYPFLLLLMSVSLQSETLDQVVAYAMKESTLVKQAKAERELARLQHEKSKAGRYGEFDIVGNYTHYNLPRTLAPLTPDVIASGRPITTTEDLYSAGLAYSVPLFTGFARTREVEIGRLAKEMAEAKVRLSREQLVYNVRALYLSALGLKETLLAQKSYTRALSRLRKQIAYEVKLGKKAKIDLYKADAALEDSRAGEGVLASNLKITMATLSSLVGKKIETLSPLSIDVKKRAYDYEALEKRIANLTKMRIASLSVRKAKKKVSKSKAVRYPQVAFSAYWGKNYGEDGKRGDWDDETLWQAGVNLKYNLFDFGTSAIDIQKAKIAQMEAAIQEERTAWDLKKELAEAIAKIERNQALYRGGEATQRLSEESEKIENIRYRHGAATLNDLLLAKSKTQRARAKVIQSRYDYQKSLYYLDYLLEKGVKDEND